MLDPVVSSAIPPERGGVGENLLQRRPDPVSFVNLLCGTTDREDDPTFLWHNPTQTLPPLVIVRVSVGIELVDYISSVQIVQEPSELWMQRRLRNDASQKKSLQTRERVQLCPYLAKRPHILPHHVSRMYEVPRADVAVEIARSRQIHLHFPYIAPSYNHIMSSTPNIFIMADILVSQS